MDARPALEGLVHPDFRPVAEMLRRQIARRQPGGAALAVYHRGEPVIDCWGGVRNRSGDPWRDDTLSVSFSTTKGVTSTALHRLVDRGALAYDDPVARHWPEFAQAGKGGITVRQLLCHEAGLHRIRRMIDHSRRMLDWDFMVDTLARERPAFAPGTRTTYHGLTYGWLVGELVRRASGLPFSAAIEELLAEPLGLDGLYCGLPLSELPRRAELIVAERVRRPSLLRRSMVVMWAWVIAWITLWRINLFETIAALVPKGGEELDYNSDEVATASIPAANGMFTARSLARLYAALAGGGELDGVRLLSPATFEQVRTVQSSRRDRVLQFAPHWRLGYHGVFTPFGPKSKGFGHFGFGGSGGWCDPERRLAMALTVNSGVGTPLGDARVISLARQTLLCADRR